MDKELHISFGNITDTGLVKEFNTDAAIDFKILNGHVFVVCDGHNGVDGHGALASKLVAESIKKYFYNRSYKDIAKALTNAITYANLTLFEQSKKDDKYNGIGSTLAIVIYREGQLFYAYAGDSRIYLYRNNKLQALTQDHVDDPANAVDADVKVLIGKSKDIKFGVCKTPLGVAEDDVFLLCTDGLTDQVPEDELVVVIGDEDKAPEHKCQDLIDLAKEKGGRDCTSIQVIEFSKLVEPKKERKTISLKPIIIGLLILAAIVIITKVGFIGYEAIKNRPAKDLMVEHPEFKEDVQEIKTNKLTTDEKVKQKKLNQEKVSIETKKEPIKTTAKKPVVEKANGVIYHDHVIKYGENLYRLAIRYNTTQKHLIELNGKKATSLVAGTKLKVPVTAIHVVKMGESFSVISDKYNVKIKLICHATDIVEGTPLKEGQTLIIPKVK